MFDTAPVVAITEDCQPVFALPGGVETTDRCVVCQAPFDPSPGNVARQKTCGDKRCKRAYANRYRRSEKPDRAACAVCGGAFAPASVRVVNCKRPECAEVSRGIRWHRWAMRPGKAKQKGMLRETVQVNMDALLARCLRPEAFAETAVDKAADPEAADGLAMWHDRKRAECAAAAPDPWDAPPPTWEGPLPGAVLPLDLDIQVGNVERLGTALHAILTRILRDGRGHDPRRPEWSLLLVGEQTSSGWAVWLPGEADIAAVRGKTFPAELRRRRCNLTIGRAAALRLKPPSVTQTGRHRVRLTTITPVCMRSDGRAPRPYPQTPSLWTALTVVAQRIGLTLPDPTAIGIARVSHETESARTTINERRGLVAVGWSGDVVLDVNPLGRWLLEVGARIGIGGRTAYGLGRIAVRDESMPEAAPVPQPEPWEVVFDGAAGKLGARLGLTGDDAKHAVAALCEQAVFDHKRPDGECEVWTVGDVSLVVQPTTLRTLRVVDIKFSEEHQPALVTELWRAHAA